MKTTLKIQGVETKTIGTGPRAGKPYHLFITTEGKFSVFDGAIAEKLSAVIGKSIDVELQEKNGYQNLTRYYGLSGVQEAQAVVTEEKVVNKQSYSVEEARKSKDVSMLTSYAKDIFIRLHDGSGDLQPEAEMQKAIELVQQARTAFEKGVEQ